MRNIYLYSYENEIVKVINNEFNNGLKILEDSCKRAIQDNETSLSIVLAGSEINDIKTGQKIVYPIFNDYLEFIIVKTKIEDKELTLDCEPVFIQDLNSKIIRPTKFENATIKEILDNILNGTNYEVGEIDDISYLPSFEVDGYITVLEALLNLVEACKAEFKAVVEIGNNQVIKRRIDVKQKTVSYMDVFLTNEDLDSMVVEEDTSELCTELIAVGNNGDEIISLQGLTKEQVKDVVSAEYYVEGDKLCNQSSQTVYGKIERVFEVECKNNIELLEKTYAELQVISKPLKIYNCESSKLISDIDYDCLGKYLRLGDKETQSYISARIIEMVTSISTPEENSVTFGDYIEEKPIKSDKIFQLQQQIEMLEQDLAQRNLKLEITSNTKTFTFVNNQGEITLTAKVTKNGQEVSDVVYDLIYTWSRFDAQGKEIAFPDGSKNKVGRSLTVKGEDVLMLNSYECQVFVPREILK